jgi:redox-sensitive bicupin YhaK (pirin superfamily)
MNLKRVFRNNRINIMTVVTATATLTKAFSTESAAASTTISNHNNQLPTITAPMKIKVIPNDKLYKSEPNPRWFGNPINPGFDPAWTNTNWLKSRFHFNFAEYHNGNNVNFGVVRVLNDDLVQPKRGFGEHPHRDMEIVTYIVNGKLTHEDSTGSVETLGRGSIQFMTAGTGISHSEFNHGDEPLRFVQVWINPRTRGLPANYGSYDASTADADVTKNIMQHLTSDVANGVATTPVKLNQDVDCFTAELEEGKSLSIDIPEGRQAYLLCVEGSLELNGSKTLERHDAAEIVGGDRPLQIQSTKVEDTENGKVAHLLMFVMKEVPGSGRKDIACTVCP